MSTMTAMFNGLSPMSKFTRRARQASIPSLTFMPARVERLVTQV